MVDIHAHILPELDDGAESVETSVEMARIAVEGGIRHMVASSHGNLFSYSRQEYEAALAFLRRELAMEGIPLKLYPGQEIFLDEKGVSRLARKELLTLNNTNYILVEFDFDEVAGEVVRRLEKVKRLGYDVVIAHPERYIFMQNDPELVYYLYEEDFLFQINGGSLLGDFGDRPRKLAKGLLSEGLVTVIATDCHDASYRAPSTDRLFHYLQKYSSSRQIHLTTSENPSRILKGLPIIQE